MVVKKLVVGSMAANCYLVWSEPSMEGIVIDPGSDGSFVSEQILLEKIDLKAIVLTHGHFDHVQATLELKLNFATPVLLNPADKDVYLDSGKSLKHWTNQEPAPVPDIDRELKEGDEIKFGNETLTVIEAPGHTPGSTCLHSERAKVLFSGDVLFLDGIGRTDFGYSDKKAMDKSLERLFALPDETVVMSGHGDDTTILAEKNRYRT